MEWVRGDTEAPERRPTDVALLIAFVFFVVVLGVWAQSQSRVDVNFFRPLNDLPGHLTGISEVTFAIGSIWAVLAVGLVLVALRQWSIALRVVVAGAGAWAIAELLNQLLGLHSIKGLDVHVRLGDGPAYPSVNVAVAVALAFALAPFLVRPLRRIVGVLVVLVAIAAMYLGTGFPSDVFGGVALGLAVVALIRVAVGTPPGRPTRAEVTAALGDLGFEVKTVNPARIGIARAAVMDAVVNAGQPVRADAFGRDQRDARLAAKIWHSLMYREPGLSVSGSRLQEVEHIAYALLLADGAGVHGPRLVKTGIGGTDIAVLVTSAPSGTPLADLDTDTITDAVLAAVWTQVDQLHRSGIAHGNLDPLRILLRDDGSAALDDFSAASVTDEQYWFDRDVVAVLVATALVVGNERAIAAAVKVLGQARLAQAIPVIQPAALPAGVGGGTKHLSKLLKALAGDVAGATGAEETPPLKIRRLSLVNIGMLIGILIALAIAIPSLEGINWSSVQSQFSNALWGWAVLAFVLYPLVPAAWATALMGCVNADLPFVPTVLTQLACTFLNLITPNGIGGTALQLDYLHKEGVPVASGGSAMVLSTGVGSVIQMGLFLLAAGITATTVSTSSSSSNSTSLWVIALVAAAVGVVLFIPKIRGKVLPVVRRAASDIWAVLRNPHKALQLFGGDLAGNLIYPALLGLCLLAFHQNLSYAQLIVVQVGAGMLGSVAPVPGGIGVQEAALTAGLTSFGIAAAPALAAVLVFRAITFAIPPIFGFFTLRWLRARGYA